MSAERGAARALLTTGVVAVVLVLAVVVPVLLVSGDDPSTATEPLSPQELADAMAGVGSNGQEPPQLSDRLDPADSAPLPDEQLAPFAEGREHATSDYAGRPLVVNFWASWCPPCVEEMPLLDEVVRSAGGDLALLGVNRSDNLVEAEALADRLDISYDLGVDDDDSLFRAVGAFGMPTTLFVDAEGVIVHRHTGGLTAPQFSELLSEHLDVNVPT